MEALDLFEGRGFAYLRKALVVKTDAGKSKTAEVYVAIERVAGVAPFDWYLDHVLRGASAIGLPANYVESLARVETKKDPDIARAAREMNIYTDQANGSTIAGPP